SLRGLGARRAPRGSACDCRGAPDPPDGPRGGRYGRGGRARPGAVAHLGNGRLSVPGARGRGEAHTGTRRIGPPRFGHLAALTDDLGLFEHALFREPRREHGYCPDDVARALVAVSREGHAPWLDRLRAVYLSFVLDAQLPDGRFHNRRAAGGAWVDEVGSDDSQGRALFGLGVAGSVAAFDAGAAALDSPSPRTNAYAVLGAAELLDP